MIKLEALADFVEKGLNTQTNETALTFPYGNGQAKYVFRIVADTTDYHSPSRDGNVVTSYIHGILYLNGSNLETAKNGSTNATLNTTLEIAVPVLKGMDEQGNKELVEGVRHMLDAFFSSNGRGSITYADDGGETAYSFGYNYNLATSGIRQNLPHIGDAFMFRVVQSWVFLPSGIYSDDISLSINGTVVPWTTLGIMRTSVQDSEVPSDSTNAAVKNVTASTQMTINVGMTAVTGTVFDKLRSYLMFGTLDKLTVRLTMVGYSNDYQMQFNEATMNGQIPLYASATFKLVEVL